MAVAQRMSVALLAWSILVLPGFAQIRAPVVAPRLPSGSAPSASPYANQAAALRAVPLPQRSLPAYSPFSGPVRAPYALPYGPNFSRPSGSPVVPFGSSGYYYHR